MSKIAIKGNESGTATFTIEAPATNTDRIFELPDEAGKILTNATPGTVLQVVQTESSTQTIIQSTSYVDGANLNATITPSSASSKILVLCSVQVYVERQTNQPVVGNIRLVRESTAIKDFGRVVGLRAGVASDNFITAECQASLIYLDSPNTTSATTYKLQGAVSTTLNAGGIYFNVGSTGVTTITLMEIAG